jgi:hypothetical protein
MKNRHGFAVPLTIAGVCIALLSPLAWSADIREAYYDPTGHELVVEIAYRGTLPDHDFTLRWGKCQRGEGESYGIAARIVDLQGHDEARENFRTQARFSLNNLECRPARVTLRLGRVSHETIVVPAPPKPR